MDWTTILLKALYGGFGALGFAILFNVPKKVLIYIFILGVLGVFVKFWILSLNDNIILASFGGASLIGIISQFALFDKKILPHILAIPAVIAMVPGIYTYNMMVGIIQLTGKLPPDEFQNVLINTTHYGLNATFIIMALSIGVSIPNLLLRRESFRDVNIFNKSKSTH